MSTNEFRILVLVERLAAMTELARRIDNDAKLRACLDTDEVAERFDEAENALNDVLDEFNNAVARLAG